MTATVCGECGVGMVPVRHPIPAGMRRHSGRGLCTACYFHAHNEGRLHEVQRLSWPLDLLLSEWERLRADGYTRANAAVRLGVKRGTLDKAIARAARRAA